jgi:hypothetical protein
MLEAPDNAARVQIHLDTLTIDERDTHPAPLLRYGRIS